MDLQEYYISTEWDVMKVPAVRNEKYYPCCEEPYPDIIFYLALRRKSLFYTENKREERQAGKLVCGGGTKLRFDNIFLAK